MSETAQNESLFQRFLFSSYGMLVGLVALCLYFTFATLDDQKRVGADAAADVAAQFLASDRDACSVLAVASTDAEGREFTSTLKGLLEKAGVEEVRVLNGDARDLKASLDASVATGERFDAIAVSSKAASWKLIENLPERCPGMSGAEIVAPTTYLWPIFLTMTNLESVANHAVVVAIIAIGMTMVIITAGIDLSVGSLVAVSAVVSTLCIARYGGGQNAGAFTVLVCSLVGIAVCAGTGAFSGLMVVHFSIPPFIVTLAMMMVARGMAYIIAGEASIYDLPDSIEWLGHGASLFGIPNTVVLMVILFVAAHIMMSHTVLGRYIYAVGGNREAARLSGVPTKRIVFLVYVVSGALAGLGGVIEASQLKSGSPRLGPMYELFVIAAVVVGGTSLSGGEGKIFGTLIGAFIMGVIGNGMNLTGVGSHAQKVVLGFMILGAVLLDKAKRGGLAAFARMRGPSTRFADSGSRPEVLDGREPRGPPGRKE